MGVARLPAALVRSGWQVFTLCPKDSFLAHTRFSQRIEGLGSAESALNDLTQAVAQCQPDVLLPGCEDAVRWFQHIARATAQPDTMADKLHLLTLVRRSLGHPGSFNATLSKTQLQGTAQRLGLRVPAQVPAPTIEAAVSAAHQLGYPLVLKCEHGHAGQQVRICHHEAELRQNHQHLLAGRPGQHIDAQQHITGTTAICAGVAQDGMLLEQVFALKVHTHPGPTGPSSVLRFAAADQVHLLDQASAMLATLIHHFRYNGFCAIDGIVQTGTDELYLLEFNPRPVPLSALGRLAGHDLCLAYARVVGGSSTATGPATETPVSSEVVLFPNEWLRDTQSSYLHGAYHDVPWDDPPLLKAIVNSVVKPRP